MVVVDYGNTPIKDLKEKKIAGLERYRAVWKKEVLPTPQKQTSGLRNIPLGASIV
jgi:hypothetical protein